MFGGAKSWAERNVAPKPCKECHQTFQPTCGGNIYCPECVITVKRRNHAKATREWRAKDPDRHGKHKTAWGLRKYGLTLADYDAMLEKQSGMCAICKTSQPGGRGKHRAFVVDHCHTSGRVRGLLCSMCNTAIGLLSDSTANLKSAINYLEANNA